MHERVFLYFFEKGGVIMTRSADDYEVQILIGQPRGDDIESIDKTGIIFTRFEMTYA